MLGSSPLHCFMPCTPAMPGPAVGSAQQVHSCTRCCKALCPLARPAVSSAGVVTRQSLALQHAVLGWPLLGKQLQLCRALQGNLHIRWACCVKPPMQQPRALPLLAALWGSAVGSLQQPGTTAPQLLCLVSQCHTMQVKHTAAPGREAAPAGTPSSFVDSPMGSPVLLAACAALLGPTLSWAGPVHRLCLPSLAQPWPSLLTTTYKLGLRWP